MSLKPSLSFQRIGSPSASHELSVFVDFQCSRCRILAEALDAHVLPHLQPDGKLAGKLSIVLRLAPQNWHISSAALAEVALAAGGRGAAPGDFWQVALALFARQEQFLNVLAQHKSQSQLRQEAAEAVAAAVPSQAVAALVEATTNRFAPATLGNNGPSSVTADLQWNVKYARQLAVQHTPTVTLDGIVQGHNFDGGLVGGLSSGWGAGEWEAWLAQHVE